MSGTVSVAREDLNTLIAACLNPVPGDQPEEVRAAFRRLDGARFEEAAPEPASPAAGDGQFMQIAFMGHIELTGYVTEITLGGQPGFRIDLPERLWGANPLAWEEYSAAALFSRRPVTEESVRRAWEAQLARAAERARQDAEWRRMQEQRALEAGDGYDEDDEPL